MHHNESILIPGGTSSFGKPFVPMRLARADGGVDSASALEAAGMAGVVERAGGHGDER